MATTTTTKPAKPAKTVTADVAKVMTDNVEAAMRGTFAEAVKAAKAAITADTRKLNALDKARAAMLDTRVQVVRATAFLMTFPESHAKAGKTAGKPSQSVIAEALGINRLTFAPFFKAASELYAKFPELETEPGRAITEDERIHVASFWKAEALRAKAVREKAAADAAKPKSGEVTTIPAEGAEGAEGGTGAGTGTDVPTSVTVETVNAAVALLLQTLDKFGQSGQGFTEAEAEVIGDALVLAGVKVSELTAPGK